MLDRERRRFRSFLGRDKPIDVWKVAAMIGIGLVLAMILAVIERDRRIAELPRIGRWHPNPDDSGPDARWFLGEPPDGTAPDEPSTRLHAD